MPAPSRPVGIVSPPTCTSWPPGPTCSGSSKAINASWCRSSSTDPVMTTVRSAALVLLLGPALYAAAQSEVPCLNNDPALFSQLHGNDPELLTRIAQEEAELEAHTTQFVQHY